VLVTGLTKVGFYLLTTLTVALFNQLCKKSWHMSRNYLVIAIWALFITGCQSKKTLNESPKDSVWTTLAVDDESVIIEEQYAADDKKGSLKARAIATLGKNEIKIAYYSPAVRGRIILRIWLDRFCSLRNRSSVIRNYFQQIA
jgi:hypothetical protein